MKGKEMEPEFKKEFTAAYSPKVGIHPYFKGKIMDPYRAEKNNYPSDLVEVRSLCKAGISTPLNDHIFMICFLNLNTSSSGWLRLSNEV